MTRLIVFTFFMLNFLAVRVCSDCKPSLENYQRTHENEEFTLYVAKDTANLNSLNFSEYKCHLSYEHDYFDNPGTGDRWFECSNGITIVENYYGLRQRASMWHLRDARRENTKEDRVLPLREISSSEEKYYQTNSSDHSLITQELITDFVYKDTTKDHPNKQILRFKRRYQFKFSPEKEEKIYPHI